MPVTRHPTDFPILPNALLTAFRDIPAAVASDAMNRGGTMRAAISPLAPTMRICAQARTVDCMVADNSALHAALARCPAGQVLVCDAKGFEDQAIFGGLMTRAALGLGIAGLVIDGAVRDSDEIVELGFPCFARAVTPRGPHKGFGGTIDGPISCGGLPVRPGDLILGDADGVTVVPLERAEAVLETSRDILAKEERALAHLAEGGTLAELYGVPEIE